MDVRTVGDILDWEVTWGQGSDVGDLCRIGGTPCLETVLDLKFDEVENHGYFVMEVGVGTVGSIVHWEVAWWCLGVIGSK